MQEFFDLLNGYNRASMMDDFHDVKKLMELDDENEESIVDTDEKKNDNNSNTNNNNISKAKKNNIREFFHSKLEKCNNFSNCKCFVRNRRPRDSDSVKNERRAAFYIREQDVKKYENRSRFEVREVILQSSLDIIHNFIFHGDDEQVNVNVNHKNKFVTEVDDGKNDNQNKKIGQYSFGHNMYYWIPEYPGYIAVKYPDLKTELTSNALHSITLFAYEELEERARDILKTKYGKSLRSNLEHAWMEINDVQLIPKGSLITEKHLIAVLAYTNHDKMQYKFKKLGFRKQDDSETEEDVFKRNAEIAHWSRALYEVVQCWGSVMSRKKPLFHGISCKLLFDSFTQEFSMPTSVTTSVRVAQNFAKGNGIILVLNHPGRSDDQCLMFDVSIMSDYPNEQERLLFRSCAQFSDILMDGSSSVRLWIKVLKYYERIRMGYFLSHVLFSEQKQEMIVHMIENFLEDRKGKNEKNDEFYENGNVPNYIQQLFDECTHPTAYFFLNSGSINNSITNVQLLEYLNGSENGEKSAFLGIFPRLFETHVYELVVDGDSYDLYFSDSHPWVVDPHSYRVNLAKEADDEPMYLTFHWELRNYDKTGLLDCLLRCDHLPTEVSNVEMNLGIYIESTESETYVAWYLDHQNGCILALHSIIESEKILLNMKDNRFTVKVMITVTEISYT